MIITLVHLLAAAEDDAVLVKHMGQSFRFSAVEVMYASFIHSIFMFENMLLQFLKARKEEEIKAAHDEAMFGVSSYTQPAETDDEDEAANPRKENIESVPVTSLLSDQVI